MMLNPLKPAIQNTHQQQTPGPQRFSRPRLAHHRVVTPAQGIRRVRIRFCPRRWSGRTWSVRLGNVWRRISSVRPLIGRITTIESERSRPTPAVPLVDDVRRPARIATMEPEARRCLRPRSRSLSNRPDRRIDLGPENRDRAASNDEREGRNGCSCVAGLSGDRMIAGQEGLYVYTCRGLIRWQKSLTISMDDGAYAALHRVIGCRFSRFLNDLARPHGCATTIPDADQAIDKHREPDGCE